MAATAQSHPMATFTKSQRRLIAAFMATHHEWDIRYDRLAAEDIDPGAHPSQALFVNLPDHFAGAAGWTLYPADGSRVGVVFGDNDPVVKDLAEALSDIGNLRVCPSTEADTEEAERVCPIFMPAMVSPPSPPPADFQHAA